MSRKEMDVKQPHHATFSEGTSAGNPEPQPEHDTLETQLEARNYFERKHINQILESIVTGLTFTKPDDPLAYIEDCVQRIRKGDLLAGKSKLHWDLFIPPPSQKDGPSRAKSTKQQRTVPPLRKKLAPINALGKGQRGDGVFMMPEVSAKPIISKRGAPGPSGLSIKGEGVGAGGKGGTAGKLGAAEGIGREQSAVEGAQGRGGDAHPGALHLLASPSAMDLATQASYDEAGMAPSGRPPLGERMTGSRPLPPIAHGEMGETIHRQDVPGDGALNEERAGGEDNDADQSLPTESTAQASTELTELEKIIEKEPEMPPPIFKGPAWDNIVFVLGGPGCGKGTNCARIAKEFNYTHLSAGDLLRAEVATGSDLGKELDLMMKEGRIVPMKVTLRLLREAMLKTDDADGFLIDGFPRQLDQAEAFEDQVAQCKFVLYFECTEQLLEQRLLERGKTSGRADDNMETIKKRFRTFVETSMPVIERYTEVGKCVKISSEPPIEEVYQNVRQHFVKPEPLYHNNVVFVLGGPGSGKGTQCVKLAEEFHLTHLSSGDLLRAEIEKGSDIGREAEDIMKEGNMVPTTVILNLIRKAMDENKNTPGFLIDGFPRAMDQAHQFEQMIGPCRAVLYFHCPLEVLENRLLERGKTSGRLDDNLETIKKRFRTFEAQSMPVIEFYKGKGKCVQVSSEDTIDSVYQIARQLFIPPSPVNHPNIIFVLGGPGCGKGTQCKRLATEFPLNHLSTGDLLRAEVEQGTQYGKLVERAMQEGGLAGNPPETITASPAAADKPGGKKHKKEKDKEQEKEKGRESGVGGGVGGLGDGAAAGTRGGGVATGGGGVESPPHHPHPKKLRIRDDLVDFRTKLLSFSSGWQDVVMDLLNTDIVRRYQSNGFLVDGFPRAMDQALEFERIIGRPRVVLYFQAPFAVLEQRLMGRAKASGRADDKQEIILQRFRTFKNESLAVIRYYQRVGLLRKIPATAGIQEVYQFAHDTLSGLPPPGERPPLKPQTAKPMTAARMGMQPISELTLPFDGENLVFVLGGPGSGKGTQCAKIVETLHWAHLSTGDLLRDEVKKGTELGKQLEADMREGKMVPLSITMDLLKAAMEERRGSPGFLIDGFPRTMEQAELFENTIGRCTFVLFFDCPHDILTQRLLKRGETSGRADDNLESIGKRLKTFDEMSMPVVEHFGKDGRVKKVLSDGDVNEITAETLKQFEGI
ncbi:hypothetical protein HDV00_000257 [Rhizophlyctis rosea]|nr:hypothetical protein HDV00_000257 [Rhizophlyctis rosea]